MILESRLINWLLDASVSAVGCNLGMSWNAVYNIMSRAEQRRLERKKVSQPKQIAIDETSF